MVRTTEQLSYYQLGDRRYETKRRSVLNNLLCKYDAVTRHVKGGVTQENRNGANLRDVNKQCPGFIRKLVVGALEIHPARTTVWRTMGRLIIGHGRLSTKSGARPVGS